MCWGTCGTGDHTVLWGPTCPCQAGKERRDPTGVSRRLKHTQQNRCKKAHHSPRLEVTLMLKWNLYSNENDTWTELPQIMSTQRPRSEKTVCALLTLGSSSQTASPEGISRVLVVCSGRGREGRGQGKGPRSWAQAWSAHSVHQAGRLCGQEPRRADPGTDGTQTGQAASGRRPGLSLDPSRRCSCLAKSSLSGRYLRTCELFCMSVVLQLVSFLRAVPPV